MTERDDDLQPPTVEEDELQTASSDRVTSSGASYLDLRDELDVTERASADDAVSALQRVADRELFRALGDCNYLGKLWDNTSRDLASYGVAVMRSWLKTGRITKMLSSRGVPIELYEHELRAFAMNFQERNDLAMYVVAHALHDFRTRGRDERGWSPDGGAQITTYFIGGCILAFPNRLREYRRLSQTDIPISPEQARDDARVSRIGLDPALVLVSGDELKRVVSSMKDREKEIVLLLLSGMEHSEIAAHLGLEGRAVEGVLYRMRRRFALARRKEES